MRYLQRHEWICWNKFWNDPDCQKFSIAYIVYIAYKVYIVYVFSTDRFSTSVIYILYIFMSGITITFFNTKWSEHAFKMCSEDNPFCEVGKTCSNYFRQQRSFWTLGWKYSVFLGVFHFIVFLENIILRTRLGEK